MNNYMAAKKETSPFTLVSLPPRKPDSRAHPAEVSQWTVSQWSVETSADQDSLTSGDPCGAELLPMETLANQDSLACGDPAVQNSLVDGDPLQTKTC